MPDSRAPITRTPEVHLRPGAASVLAACAAAALAAVLFAVAVAAQPPAAQPPPLEAGPMALLVAAPRGGSLDRLAGVFRPLLAQSTGKPLEQRNEGTTTAGEGLAAAAAGHRSGEIRLVLTTNTALIAGRLLGLGAEPRPLQDIEWLGVLARYANAVVVRAQDPARTLDEWIAAARKADRPLRYAAGVPGSMAELAGRLLADKTGIVLAYRPIDEPDAPFELLQNDGVDLVIDGLPNALEEVARGRGRILAVTSAQRSESAPQARAFGELWPGEDFSDLVLLGIGGAERADIRAEVRRAWQEVRKRPALAAEVRQAGATYLGAGERRVQEAIDDEFLRHAALIARYPPGRQ